MWVLGVEVKKGVFVDERDEEYDLIVPPRATARKNAIKTMIVWIFIFIYYFWHELCTASLYKV